MQTSYQMDMNQAIAGMPVDATFDPKAVESALAIEKLEFGFAAFKSTSAANPRGVRAPKRNAPVITYSADLVTGNTINGFVNGVALAQRTFATDHLTTITAHANDIVAALLAQGIVATFALSGSNRVITFTVTDANVLFATFVVAAGASQATVSFSHGTSDTAARFAGILRYSAQQLRTVDGLAGYAAQDAVAIVRRGKMWSPITSDVADGADVYVDMTSGNEGKLTDVTTAPNFALTGLKFKGAWTTAGLGLAQVEMNLP